MKRNLFTSFMLALCLGLSALILTACGKTDYDMSGVAFNDITKDYTESTVILTENDLEGTLPEGVEVSFEYFSDEERTQTIIAKDAGIYYVTAKFTGDNKHNAIQDKYATLTINKVNFSNVTFDIAGTYTDSTNNKVTVVAKSEDENNVYFEYDAKQFRLSIQNESISSDAITREIGYYKSLNDDKTDVLESSKTTNNVVEKYGDVLYIKVKYQDKNHNPISIIKRISIEKITKEINTYEDLIQMNKDIYEIPSAASRNAFRYLLKQDIDLGGEVWNTISPVFGKDYFCSEFDGNGHTISNFKITNDSTKYTLTLADNSTVTVDAQNTTDQCVHFGFFGYIAAANIHDLTLDNITVNIDMDEMSKTASAKYCYYGTLMARGESDVSAYGIQGNASTILKDCNVKNVNANIVASKAYIGGVIGCDHNANTETKIYSRENLNTNNVSITVKKGTAFNDRLSVGGIVAETQSGDVTLYKNCTVTNGVVKVYAYQNDDNTNESSYGSKPVSVGTILGWNRGGARDVKIENCSGNLTIDVYVKNASQLQYNELYGANSAELSTDEFSTASNIINKYYLGVLVQE